MSSPIRSSCKSLLEVPPKIFFLGEVAAFPLAAALPDVAALCLPGVAGDFDLASALPVGFGCFIDIGSRPGVALSLARCCMRVRSLHCALFCGFAF